jgi:hypothetical protein
MTAAPNTKAWGFALSAMHVPSGFFVQGHYQAVSYSNDRLSNGVGIINSAYWGDGGPAAPYCASAANGGFYPLAAGGAEDSCTNPGNKKDANQWLIQAGNAKNWFGVGNTSLYGEYGRAIDWGATSLGRDYGNFSVNSNPFDTQRTSTQNVFGIKNVTSTEMTLVGAGIVQAFDSSATEIYLGWRRMSADVTAETGVAVLRAGTPAPISPGLTPSAGTTGCSTAATAQCVGANTRFSPADIDVITAGIRVKF